MSYQLGTSVMNNKPLLIGTCSWRGSVGIVFSIGFLWLVKAGRVWNCWSKLCGWVVKLSLWITCERGAGSPRNLVVGLFWSWSGDTSLEWVLNELLSTSSKLGLRMLPAIQRKYFHLQLLYTYWIDNRFLSLIGLSSWFKIQEDKRKYHVFVVVDVFVLSEAFNISIDNNSLLRQFSKLF